MADPTSPEAQVPVSLGDFRIEAVLGEGGSGTVYAALWGHREVALKVLRDAWLPSDGERRRFWDEARLLADVNHPGVVRILGFGELPDGRPYLAMERLEGEGLAARLQRGALPVERALALFDQLCQAVQTLHGRGLIHRDIKPENVFLVRDERYAVLLDFGIAKPVDAPDSTVTREGGVRGTPAYMAPERFFGAPANAATDIYELGVVLYAMVTGRLPWDGAADPVTRLSPRRPSELGIRLPGALEGALLEALSSRADGRPATVAALADRVARAVHEAPTVAGGVRRTADLPTADGQVSLATGPAALTVPGKGRADVATAPTLRVTPPGAPARGRPGVATAPTIASYWSDSNPSIVVAELPGASGDVGPDVRSARPRAGPLRAATLGVRLPTPADPMPAVAPSTMSRWSRLAVIVGGGLAGAALLVGGTYLLTRPAPEQPLSVGTTGLVRSPEPTPRPAATPATRPIAPGRDSMIWKVHPGDTKLLLRLSQDQLRGSEVYKTLLETTKTPLKIPQLAVLQKACGIDLLDRVDWLSIGLSGTPDRLGVDFMLHGSWTRDELERCVTRLGESAGLAWTLKRHGPVTRVVLGSSAFWIGWPDPKTLFLSNRDIADRPWVTARLAGRRAAREDSGLRRMYDYVPTGVTAWVVMSSMAVVKDSVFDALPRPSTAVVSLRVSSELTLVAVARYDTDARALQARDAIRIRLHKLKRNTFVDSLLTRAEVTGTGRQVRVSFFLERASALLFAQALSSYLESADLSAVTPHGTKREGAAPSKP